MSATNWNICPKCEGENDEYEEYEGESLREDYEIVLRSENNKFWIHYSCECQLCNFQREFFFDEENKVIKIDGKENIWQEKQ